jgi:pimeloyl-ACP methyl ester carboxylesterase
MTKENHFYLFRGLVREKGHWGDFPDHLLTAFPQSLVTMIDLPGAGEHYKKSSPFTVKGIVEEMRREYLGTLRSGDSPHLVAISLGGMIAVEWMKRYPDDFKSATLINTSAGGDSPFYDRLRPAAFLHLLKVPFLSGRAKEARILELVSNNSSVFEETLTEWEKICLERPVSLENSLRQLFAAAFWETGDFTPHVPVTLLASIQDRMVSVECSRRLAMKWRTPLKEHPTAGHDLSVDDPQWVAQIIQESIAGP